MPIYEYECKNCGKVFEKLLLRSTNNKLTCPSCSSENTEKKLSVFSGIITNKSGCQSSQFCEASGHKCSSHCPHAAR